MEIALYYAPIACSLAPYITLTEAGADFEVRTINLRKGQHKSPEYLKINPKHKVPLLVVDGKTLSENVAIQQWIDMTFPNANLFRRIRGSAFRQCRCWRGARPAFTLI